MTSVKKEHNTEHVLKENAAIALQILFTVPRTRGMIIHE